MDLSIILTGGTFSKFYNNISGNLEINQNFNDYMEDILFYIKENHNIKLYNIINKDSLDFTIEDRNLLLKKISGLSEENVIIVHGTDTMNISAKFLYDNKIFNKKIIFVGSMIPISINPLEGAMNLSSAIGFLNSNPDNGIYISMHGLVKEFNSIIKNKDKGIFQYLPS